VFQEESIAPIVSTKDRTDLSCSFDSGQQIPLKC